MFKSFQYYNSLFGYHPLFGFVVGIFATTVAGASLAERLGTHWQIPVFTVGIISLFTSQTTALRQKLADLEKKLADLEKKMSGSRQGT